MAKDTIETLRNDLMYLARRQKALEDDIGEWTEFMTTELLKQGIVILKDKKSLDYFKKGLQFTFKENYEKLESLFSTVNKYFDERKAKRHKYTIK